MRRYHLTKFFACVLLLGLRGMAFSDGVPSPEKVRLPYNNPGLIVDLGVGLWANPFPVDWDEDGDTDLLVSTTDKPSNGVYFFENDGSDIFYAGKRLAGAQRRAAVSYINGEMMVCTPGVLYQDFRTSLFGKPATIGYHQEFYNGRSNQWKFADFDGDGVYDLLIGASDWREYGWDDAYDGNGNWTHGPLHGYVYWVKNLGSNEKPAYGKAEQVLAGDQPLDVYGRPSPNIVDWDNDGDMDLICGEFLDRISFFENVGSRSRPCYAPGGFLRVNGKTLHLELEMPEVVVYDWDGDNDPDIVVGKEDGRVVLIENTGIGENGLPILATPRYFQQRAEYVKCGALSTPCSYDWDNDGDDDIISGNTAGFLELFENLDGGNPPQWSAPQRLTADGQVFRIMAGSNMSIQGPAEAKWGYTVPYVADWDMDGLADIVLNSIVGKIIWLRNVGSRERPRLAAAQPVKVEWQGKPPKPEWTWWEPKADELVVQWRTRPIVLDLNKDGLNDLIVIDHEGYLSFFERKRRANKLVLLPGKRIFFDEQGKPLRLNARTAGGSGRRKIDMVDWDNDGDLDLLINSINTALYRNIGENGKFVFLYCGDLSLIRLGGHSTSPCTVDWNGDGVRDLLIGAEDGFFYYLPRKTWNDLQGLVVPLDLPANARPLEFSFIPSGSFLMGSPDSARDRTSDEFPQHKVSISKGFYLGKYEVTQAQWQEVMGANPSHFDGNPDNPVECVSWFDCQNFIDRLNNMRLAPGTFRLPTEAEWEYACRAGTSSRFYWGDDPDNKMLDDYAWHRLNSDRRTHPVGLKKPNPWGLYDMMGNVLEWCQDWHDDDYYSLGELTDPQGPESGTRKEARGTDWSVTSKFMGSATRNEYEPGDSRYYLGLRLVLEPAS